MGVSSNAAVLSDGRVRLKSGEGIPEVEWTDNNKERMSIGVNLGVIQRDLSGRAVLSAHQIKLLLQELGSELDKVGMYASVDLFGGAVIALYYSDTRRSIDIDGVLRSGSYSVFKNLVQKIAESHKIQNDWFNQDVTTVVNSSLVGVSFQGQVSFGGLTIRIPKTEYLLAMKLLAARQKDLGDAVVLAKKLGFTSKQQLTEIVKKYIPIKARKERQKGKGQFGVIERMIERVAEELKNV
jgi:hypothetical protein